MAKPSLSSIYNRLNGVDPYHPFSAETFSDWSVEAGDMVSVSKGSTKYSSPVGSTTLEWNGAPQVTMTSTGQQKRDSVTKAAEKKYSRGGGGYRNTRDVNTSITQNREMIELEAHDRKSDTEALSSRITITAGKIESVVTKTGIDKLGNNETLYSKVDQTATAITSVVSKTGVNRLGKNETLYSKITQNASKIELKVDKNGIASTLNITPQSVKISASKIDLEGYVTVSELEATDAKITYLMSGSATAAHLKTGFLDVNSSLEFKGYECRWTQVQSMTGTTYYCITRTF